MPPLASATVFLAQSPATAGATSLDAGNPVVFLGLLIGAALTILTVVDKVDAMLHRRKRVPAMESEFVTKAELGALADKLDAVSNSMNKEFRDLYRALGIAEGKLDGKGK